MKRGPWNKNPNARKGYKRLKPQTDKKKKESDENTQWILHVYRDYLILHTNQDVGQLLPCMICGGLFPGSGLILEHWQTRTKRPDLISFPGNWGVTCPGCNLAKHKAEQRGEELIEYREKGWLVYIQLRAAEDGRYALDGKHWTIDKNWYYHHRENKKNLQSN